MNELMNTSAVMPHAHSIMIVGGSASRADCQDEVYDEPTARRANELIDRPKMQIGEREGRILARVAVAIDCNPELHGAFVQLSMERGMLSCSAFIDERHEDELIRELRSIGGVSRIQIRVTQ